GAGVRPRVARYSDPHHREPAAGAAGGGVVMLLFMRNFPGPAGGHTDHALWALTVALPDEEHP
ncbi:hypothetical protein, partial [Nocardia wallacei]|uniref:hypothetical protein n=1 Tax=Nocardia wallacei TaxID=480035 RepID=UPI0024542EB6